MATAIQSTCYEKNDHEILSRLGGSFDNIRNFNPGVHSQCYKTFTRTVTVGQSEKTADVYDLAFVMFCPNFEKRIMESRALKMTDLVAEYKTFLISNGLDPNSAQAYQSTR